jgi:mono/diheme cytochrome c family protein
MEIEGGNVKIIATGRLAGAAILASLIVLAPPLYAQGGASAAPAGNADHGKQIYKTYGCYQCHGYSGQGGAGAKLAPNPLSYPSFSKYVRAPKGDMPPYTTKVLSDSEMADIYAFLQTIPKAPDPKTIPLLNSN